MYTREQITKGLKNPTLLTSEFLRQWRRLKRSVPHDVGIHGSYDTGNVGDRALGDVFESRIGGWGYRTRTFPRTTEYSNARYTILGGGGVLHDWYGTEHLETRLDYASSGERGFIIGVGVPGFHSDEARQLVRNTVPQMDLITVRDEWSKRNLRAVADVDCTVTACPAFCYSDPESPNNGRTGVNFRPFFRETDITEEILQTYFEYDEFRISEAQRQYVKNAQSVCDRLRRPIFIPFHERDAQFARNYLDIEIAGDTVSVRETLRKVSRVDRMVTTRYHSLIFAAVCRTDVLAVAYEPKVSELADRLGVPSYLPHESIPVDFSPVSNVDTLENEAQANFDFLRTHMSEQQYEGTQE